ncbi:MAG: cupin [Desulfobacterales bacterium]|nr:MAG: cupin [Desulfobacterales bacterium]
MHKETIKNISTEAPEKMAALIEPRPNQVVSMALFNSEHVHINLSSFADGEMVSKEEYPDATIYYLLEGETIIARGGRKDRLQAGDVLAVPGHVLHAVGGLAAFRMLQITIPE